LRRWWLSVAAEQDIPPPPALGDELFDEYGLTAGASHPDILELDRAFDAVAPILVRPPALGKPERRIRRDTLSNFRLGFAFFSGLLISVVASPVGVSGAVFLLAVQLSILYVPSPAITPTNLLFNVVAGPGALARYRP
jgi:hypothetical protein